MGYMIYKLFNKRREEEIIIDSESGEPIGVKFSRYFRNNTDREFYVKKIKGAKKLYVRITKSEVTVTKVTYHSVIDQSTIDYVKKAFENVEKTLRVQENYGIAIDILVSVNKENEIMIVDYIVDSYKKENIPVILSNYPFTRAKILLRGKGRKIIPILAEQYREFKGDKGGIMIIPAEITFVNGRYVAFLVNTKKMKLK